MNFLALCQRTRAECHLSGTGPASVVLASNPKDMQNVINWVADAWRELQGIRNWHWQWENPTLTIAANTSVLAQAVAPSRYDKDAAYLINGGGYMGYLPWDLFRMSYPAAESQEGTPHTWSIRPDLAFVVDTKPPANVEITVERFANPAELTADADIPGLPADLHMYLVWAAVMKFASHEEAGSLYQTAKANADRIHAAILERCLPEYTLGGPLA